MDLILPNKANQLILSQQDSMNIQKNSILKGYETKRNEAINVPTPKIGLLHSEVLVKMVPPRMKEFEGSLLVNKIDVSEQELRTIQSMSESVDFIQEVLLIGQHLESMESYPIKPGDFVYIDYSRFRKMKEDHKPGMVETEIKLPIVGIDGETYMLIDSRDIKYYKKREDMDLSYYTV